MLEVIAETLSDVRKINEAGANRIELVTALSEGGLTPSIGLVEQAVHISKIPVRAMVRPHSRSFVYDRDDLEVMVQDIKRIRNSGADGIVIGVLTHYGKVDKEATERLLHAADGMHVTFHRAFDEVEDQEEALSELLILPQIDTLLTSGGCSNVNDARGKIKRLSSYCRGSHLTLMAGCGLTIDNVESFIRETRVQFVHLGSGVRAENRSDAGIDSNKIRSAVERVQRGMKPE
jgi:copper homeostasis protein